MNYASLYTSKIRVREWRKKESNSFLNRLCNGIVDAVEILIEKEKVRCLNILEWQNGQDRNALYKEIVNNWIAKRKLTVSKEKEDF